jgi:hypothetical protein
MKIFCAVSPVIRWRGIDLILPWRGAFVVAAASVVAGPIFSAHASTVDFYDVQIYTVTPPDITATNSSQETASGSGTTAIGNYSYSVLAGPGLLGDSNSVTATSTTGDQRDVRSNTNFTMSNIVLTGPAGSAFVDYSVNFNVTGSFLLSSAGNATARGIVEVDDAVGELGSMLASTNAADDGAGGVFQGQSPSANSSFNLTATTEKEIGENGSPVTIMLNLATSANVAANDGSGSAAVDFLDPLSFPTRGPVFNFFDLAGNPISGWTANSSDGCIVNNTFRCGLASPPGSVPELSTWVMMVAGFAGLGLAGCRRGPRRAAVPTGEELGL